ncbi:hypothetical protein ABZY44_03590, partial [Streptomyces sp. NPDC006544]
MGNERRLLTLLMCLVLGGGLTAAVLGAARAGAAREPAAEAAGLGLHAGDAGDPREQVVRRVA